MEGEGGIVRMRTKEVLIESALDVLKKEAKAETEFLQPLPKSQSREGPMHRGTTSHGDTPSSQNKATLHTVDYYS
jgi:hypothetical protein